MFKGLAAAAGILICAGTLASADNKHKPKPNNSKAIAQVQADIRRDEAQLAAAQRAGDKAAIAREQADLQRDREQLQRLQAGLPVDKHEIKREDKDEKHEGKENKKHGRKHEKDRERERER